MPTLEMLLAILAKLVARLGYTRLRPCLKTTKPNQPPCMAL